MIFHNNKMQTLPDFNRFVLCISSLQLYGHCDFLDQYMVPSKPFLYRLFYKVKNHDICYDRKEGNVFITVCQSGQRTPGQRPLCTENPLDRDPPGERPPPYREHPSGQRQSPSGHRPPVQTSSGCHCSSGNISY